MLGGRAQSECEAEPLAPGQQPLPEVVGWHHTQTHPSAILGAGPTCRSDHDSLARRDLLTRPPFGQATHGDSPLRTRSIARWERALADSAQTDAKGHLLVNWYWWGTRARQAIASRARSICCGRWCSQIIDGQVVEEHLRVNGDASVLECVAESANSLAVGMASFEVNVQDLLVVPRTPLVQHHFDTIDDEHGEQTACRRVKELLHLRSQRMRQQRRPPLKKADDVISRKF